MKNNNMKIIMALLIIFSVNAKAQDFKHYPLSEVKDTAQYLYLNFIKQKDYFVGKPFSEIVKIYKQDLPLSYFSYSTTSPYIDPNGKEYIDGAELYWLETPRWDYLFDNYYSELTFFNVEFKPPYTVEEDTYVNSLPSKNLTTDDEANGLKDFIVKDIDISGKYHWLPKSTTGGLNKKLENISSDPSI